MGRPCPMVEYAHKIGKNTAEFTTSDMVKYTEWWLKQPIRKDLLNMKKVRLAMGEESHKAASHKAASHEGENEGKNEGTEIVASMDLKRKDVEALLFALDTIFTEYNMDEHEYAESLTEIRDGLQGVL